MSKILIDGQLGRNTSAQLANTEDFKGSPLLLANLAALQGYTDLEVLKVGQFGYATDTGITYQLTVIGNPPSTTHTWLVKDKNVLSFPTKGNFPATGTAGIIYISEETWLSYAWGGAEYKRLSDVVTAATVGNFPAVGELKVLYIATTANALYYWNGASYESLTQGVNPLQPNALYFRKGGDDSKTGKNNDDQALLTAYQAYVNAQAHYIDVSSIIRSGSTATCTTSTPHGYIQYDTVLIFGAVQPEYNGYIFVATIVNQYQFTYTVSGTPATPATGTIHTAKSPVSMVCLDAGIYTNQDIDAYPYTPWFVPNATLINSSSIILRPNGSFYWYKLINESASGNATFQKVDNGTASAQFNYWNVKNSSTTGILYFASDNTGITYLKGESGAVMNNYTDTLLTVGANNTLYLDCPYIKGSIPSSSGATVRIKCPNYNGNITAASGETIYIDSEVFNGTVTGAASSTIYINCPNRQNLTIVKNGGTFYINEALYNSNVVFVAKNGDNNFSGLVVNQPMETIEATETYINSLSPAPSATNRWGIKALDDSLFSVGNGIVLKEFVDLYLSHFTGASLVLWNSNIVNLESYLGLGLGYDISIYNYPSASSTRYINIKYIKNAGVTVDLSQGTSYLNFNLFETGTSSVAISCKAGSRLICVGHKITAGSITADGANAIIDLTFVEDTGSCTFSEINGGVILRPMTSYYSNLVLKVPNGGTGINVWAKGDLPAGNSSNALGKITIGGTGKVLTANIGSFTLGADWVDLGVNINTASTVVSRTSVQTGTGLYPSFTVPAGTNRLVLLAIGIDNADARPRKVFFTGSEATGGIQMKHASNFYLEVSDNNTLDFWYMTEQDLSGLGAGNSYTFAMEFDNTPSSSDIGYNFAVYDNVNQFSPFKSVAKATSSSSSVTITVNDCSIGDYIVSFGLHDNTSTPDLTVDSPFTRRALVSFTSAQLGTADYIATTTTQNVTWRVTSGSGTGAIGFGLRKF